MQENMAAVKNHLKKDSQIDDNVIHVVNLRKPQAPPPVECAPLVPLPSAASTVMNANSNYSHNDSHVHNDSHNITLVLAKDRRAPHGISVTPVAKGNDETFTPKRQRTLNGLWGMPGDSAVADPCKYIYDLTRAPDNRTLLYQEQRQFRIPFVNCALELL